MNGSEEQISTARAKPQTTSVSPHISKGNVWRTQTKRGSIMTEAQPAGARCRWETQKIKIKNSQGVIGWGLVLLDSYTNTPGTFLSLTIAGGACQAGSNS